MILRNNIHEPIKSFRNDDPSREHFHQNHPDAEWEPGLIHAEEIGLGTRHYEVVRI